MTTNKSSPKPWADSPLALIPTPMFLTKNHDLFTSGASHMCMVHNSIFRGYNSIYQQAPHIRDADKADFIGYCLTWHKFLRTHAENEETSLFPSTEELLEDKTIWEESHKEHDSFMPDISRMHDYLVELESPNDFSGPKLLEIMSSFQESFAAHMQSEISTIAALASHAKTPKEGSAEEKSTRNTFDSREGNSLMKSGMTDVLPFFLFNFDREYEDGLWADWPPIPGPVRWVLLSVARFLHPGWWKFAACDAGGHRKLLYAVSNSE